MLEHQVLHVFQSILALLADLLSVLHQVGLELLVGGAQWSKLERLATFLAALSGFVFFVFHTWWVGNYYVKGPEISSAFPGSWMEIVCLDSMPITAPVDSPVETFDLFLLPSFLVFFPAEFFLLDFFAPGTIIALSA